MDKRMYPWYRQRGYLHFDLPVGIKKASSIVSNPGKVAKHAFWPLIDYQIVAEKLTKSDSGKLEKKAKERPIAYAAHVDSHIYAYYSQLLSERYEQELQKRGIDQHVLAFRSLGKSNFTRHHPRYRSRKFLGNDEEHVIAIAIIMPTPFCNYF